MSKTVTSFTAQLVTFDTPLPVTDVIARLDVEINKQGSAEILQKLRTAATRAEIEEVVNTVTGANDFLYFVEYNHHKWLDVYFGVDDTPATIVYTIGNPLVAQTILQYDLRAGYNIPPRLLILEKADRTGTNIVYHLPSSVMALNHNPKLKAAAEALDDKLEGMITKVVTGV